MMDTSVTKLTLEEKPTSMMVHARKDASLSTEKMLDSHYTSTTRLYHPTKLGMQHALLLESPA